MDEMILGALEDTIPHEDADQSIGDDGEMQDCATPANEGSDPTPQNGALTLRYNHEDIEVSLSEAVRLAQQGMHFENLGKAYRQDMKQLLSRLDYYANLHGQDILAAVNQLIDSGEEAFKQQLKEKIQDEELVGEILGYREKALGKSETLSVAEQFSAVKALFPEIDNVDMLPESVIKAAEQGGDLEKEILRFLVEENRKIALQERVQQENNRANIGKVGIVAENDLFSAMMRGIWGN